MSLYIPSKAVMREKYMQQKRRAFGLTTGEYLKYPSSEAKDYFVVKASQLTDEKRARMDMYLAQMALYRAEEEAKSAKNVVPNLEQDMQNLAPGSGDAFPPKIAFNVAPAEGEEKNDNA